MLAVKPIAVDAMGGDIGPSVNVEGAIHAVREDGARVVLVGDENIVRAEVVSQGGDAYLSDGRLAIRHAPEVVAMDEKPAVAVRKKKASSMRVTCDLVKTGECAAALSAGNSGAMMAVALFVFGRVRGVERPCIAAPFPSRSKKTTSFLVDAGANTDCTPNQLLQFGLMGAVYAEVAHGVMNPGIGLVSNGSEDVKGNDLTRATHQLFSDAKGVNFRGYVEGNHVVDEEFTVVVTDGFTGNIMLKTAEGAFRLVVDQIKSGYGQGSILEKLGGALSRSVFMRLKERFDYREYGGAPLLGLNQLAFIAHGSSDGYAIRRAIGSARALADTDFSVRITDIISMNGFLVQPPTGERAS